MATAVLNKTKSPQVQGNSTDDSTLTSAIDKLSTLNLAGTDLKDPRPYHFVESTQAVTDMIDSLKGQAPLYVDLEGINLSRQGSISILQILDSSENRIYLIDIHSLGSKAFTTAGS